MALGAAPALPAAERSLRDVLDVLLQDMALEPIDPATLPWNRPIFILRSMPLDRLARLVAAIHRHAPAPALHVMSHARDAESIRATAPGCTFHAYTTPGRYRLEDVPLAMLDRLRRMEFGMLVFPDPGTSEALCREVERIFEAIDPTRMVTFTTDGAFARAADWPRRQRARSAFLRLVEWYQSSPDPASSMSENQEPSAPFRATNVRS